MSATHLKPSAAHPAMPHDAVGIRIAHAPLGRAIVLGTYQLTAELAGAIDPPRARAIVVVYGPVGSPLVRAPFRERVLFADDEVVTHVGPRGLFSIDLVELYGELEGPTFAFVSLASVVSNVLTLGSSS